MCVFFFFKQKTAYDIRISDWSSDVCSSVLGAADRDRGERGAALDRQRRLPAPAVRVFEALLRRLARLDIVASPPRPEPARRSALLRADRCDRGIADGAARPWADDHLRRDLVRARPGRRRSEEPTSELQSLMRISYAFFCLKKKK